MATAPIHIYTLSLHDALPIFGPSPRQIQVVGEMSVGLLFVPLGDKGRHSRRRRAELFAQPCVLGKRRPLSDRKSTRLNSSHLGISYAVFCLNNKIENRTHRRR